MFIMYQHIHKYVMKIYIKLLRHVSLSIHHLQTV